MTVWDVIDSSKPYEISFTHGEPQTTSLFYNKVKYDIFSKIENRGNESKGRDHTVSARLDVCSHPTFHGIPTAEQFQRQSLRLQIKQSIKVWEQVILCQVTMSQLLNFQKIHKLISLVLVT